MGEPCKNNQALNFLDNLKKKQGAMHPERELSTLLENDVIMKPASTILGSQFQTGGLKRANQMEAEQPFITPIRKTEDQQASVP